jgi:hypothetical protein
MHVRLQSKAQVSPPNPPLSQMVHLARLVQIVRAGSLQRPHHALSLLKISFAERGSSCPHWRGARRYLTRTPLQTQEKTDATSCRVTTTEPSDLAPLAVEVRSCLAYSFIISIVVFILESTNVLFHCLHTSTSTPTSPTWRSQPSCTTSADFGRGHVDQGILVVLRLHRRRRRHGSVEEILRGYRLPRRRPHFNVEHGL